MVKCLNCGTGWTSEGLPLCPVCGTTVETPAKPPLEQPAVDRAATPAEAVRKNGSTVVLGAQAVPCFYYFGRWALSGDQFRWIIVVSMTAIAVISLIACLVPMSMGLRAIKRLEF